MSFFLSFFCGKAVLSVTLDLCFVSFLLLLTLFIIHSDAVDSTCVGMLYCPLWEPFSCSVLFSPEYSSLLP